MWVLWMERSHLSIWALRYLNTERLTEYEGENISDEIREYKKNEYIKNFLKQHSYSSSLEMKGKVKKQAVNQRASGTHLYFLTVCLHLVISKYIHPQGDHGPANRHVWGYPGLKQPVSSLTLHQTHCEIHGNGWEMNADGCWKLLSTVFYLKQILRIDI